MDPLTDAALSAAFDAVFVATKKLFEIAIANLAQNPSGISSRGEWHGKWIVHQPHRYHPKRVEDIVTLRVGRNGNVTGSGRNPYYGKFKLTGADTAYAVTLIYRGEGPSANHPGVCLLIKSSDGSRMDGVWFQFRGDAPLVGGTVALKRIR